MTDYTFNHMPLYVAGLTLFLELGATLPWPMSGAVSAGVATTILLAFQDRLIIATQTVTPPPVGVDPRTPDSKPRKFFGRRRLWAN